MECKNCFNELDIENDFCNNCGAKVIKQRITTKFIFIQLLEGFGWNNVFFYTLKNMFIQPNIVLNEYLNGTRKKYVKPFSFLLIGITLALTIFGFFRADYDTMMTAIPSVKDQIELANKDLSQLKDITAKELRDLQIKQESAKFSVTLNKLMFKYYTAVMLLFIPLYSLLSKWTYKKPYNYGEHIVINTYINGAYLYLYIILFFIAKFINPIIFSYSLLFLMAYYFYTFKKLYQHNLKVSFVKLLRFLLILVFASLLIIILGIIIGVISKFINP